MSHVGLRAPATFVLAAGLTSILLSGLGTGAGAAPGIAVAPDSVWVSIAAGDTALRGLTISNTGDADLHFTIRTAPSVAASAFRLTGLAPGANHVTGFGASPTRSARSDRAPAGLPPAPTRAVSTPGASVLLIQDVAPWETASNQAVLAAHGLAYDLIPTASLSSTDLHAYQLVIVASDQTPGAYDVIRNEAARFESFVSAGGVLEFHAASMGYHGGNSSGIVLPGGATIAFWVANTNRVLLPGHPAVAGVPALFEGNSASHAVLDSLPADAAVITDDGGGRATLVEYHYGAGIVIASGQTLEYGFANGQAAGIILENLIPYSAAINPFWLKIEPVSGVVPPGGTADVALEIDGSRLVGGDYHADVVVSSDDSLVAAARASVRLHVTGVPQMTVIGPTTVALSTQDYSTAGASTLHTLPVSGRAGAGAHLRLDVEGYFPDSTTVATLVVEGQTLGHAGNTGVACAPGHADFDIDAPTFASWIGDRVVSATVTNTAQVFGVGCVVNRHRLTLSYASAGDSVMFGSLFSGQCRTLVLSIQNPGTDRLEVTSVVAGDPAYDVNPTSFGVAPGAAESLFVRFCPDRIGEIDALLSFASNAGPATVALTGAGVEAPVAMVSPDSVGTALFTGQHADLPVTLSNTGGSTLEFAAAVEITALSAPAAAHRADPASRTTRPCAAGLVWGVKPAVTKAFVAAGSPSRVAHAAAAGPARVLSVPPVIVSDPAGDGGVVDLVSLRGLSSRDSLELALEFTATVNVYDTGGYLSLDVDQDPSTGTLAWSAVPGQDIGAEYAVALFNLQYGMVDLYSTVTGYYIGSYPARVESNRLSFAIPLSALGGDDGNLDLDGVVGTSSYATDWFPDTGHGTVRATWWLSVAPDHGSVAAGGSMPLLALVDAHGLDGGPYQGNVVLTTNDPAHPMLRVPVGLQVTAAADLVVAPTALDFDSVFVGVARAETLRISNEGVLPLAISSTLVDDPRFTAANLAVVLPPRTSADLIVQFVPTGAGDASGLLTISSDDPDAPSTTIPLSGTGIEPPVLVVEPDSLTAALFSGEHADRILTIRNTGASDLHFSLETVDRTGGSLARAGLGGIRPLARLAPGRAASATGAALAKLGRLGLDAPTRALRPEESAGPPRPLTPLGATGAKTPMSRLAAPGAFGDGFEDGDFAGWADVSDSTQVEVTSATAANGTQYSLHQFATSPGFVHFAGLARDFGPLTPANVGFWVRPGSTGDATGYFVLRSSGGADVIWFYATPGGHFYVNGDMGGDQSYPFTALTWYHVEFRDIDFTAKQFDYYVNGSLVQAAVPFRNGPYVQDVQRLDIYNASPGSEAWWDEIAVGTRGPADWIHLASTSGVVGPGAQLDMPVTLDATGQLGGSYQADIVVTSDDPVSGTRAIPVRMQVTGIPQLAVIGPPTVVTSSQDYFSYGAVTSHMLPVTGPVSGGATFTLTANGDYGDPGEYASLSVEGHVLGVTSATGADCSPATRSFRVDAPTFASIASDDSASAQVTNSVNVDVFCTTNRHTVTLSYDSPGDHLAFGPVYVGACRAGALTVENRGTEVLHVTAVSVDDPAYAVDSTSFTLVPGSARSLSITLCADRVGPIDATLSIASDGGSSSTALTGTGIEPPIVTAAPDSIGASLLGGQTADVLLNIKNSGADTLRYSVGIDFTPPPGPVTHARTALAPTPAHDSARLPWGVLGDKGRIASNRVVTPARSDSGPALPLPVIATDPEGDAFGVDVTVVRGDIRDGNLEIEVEMASAFSPYDFGGAMSLDTDRDPTTGFPPYYGSPGQDVGTDYVVYFFALGSGAVDVYQTGSGFYVGSYPVTTADRSFRFAIPLVAIAPGATAVDADLACGYSFGPTDWVPDIGHVTIGRSWAWVEPAGGTLGSGQAFDHTVHLDASTLLGGDYSAKLVIDSNDPSRPRLRLPIGLHVTGVPRIAVWPTTLDFGTVFVTATRRDSIRIVNPGSDTLHVTQIAASDSQFVPQLTSLVIAPRDSAVVHVDFSPGVDQPVIATLTIDSDDPDSASVHVALTGAGRLPPLIGVTPDSLSAAAVTGEVIGQTLSIANTGASDLHFTIAVEPAGGAPRAVARSATRPLRPEESPPRTASGTAVARPIGRASVAPLPFQDGFEDGDANGWTDSGFGNPYEITTATAANGSQRSLHIMNSVTVGHYTGLYHDLVPGQPGSVSFWVRPGSSATANGYFVLGDSTAGYAGIFFIALYGSFYVNGYSSFSFSPLTWYHIEFRNIDFVARTFDFYVNDSPVMTGIFFNGYGITAFTRVDLYNFDPGSEAWWDEIRIGGTALSWLRLAASEGTVPPGSQSDVGVTLDATGLYPGDYRATLAVRSDDPVTPQLARPVHLHVIGAPRIAVRPTALHFGTVFVGMARSETLEVINRGTDVLHVSAITSADPRCVPTPASFDLAPTESTTVAVQFTPPAAGPLSSTLTLVSDDPIDSSLTVAMDGVGALPPDITVGPDSLSASLFSGGRQQTPLSIGNVGGSDLDYHIRLEYTSSVAASSPRATLHSSPVPFWGSPPTLPARSAAVPTAVGAMPFAARRPGSAARSSSLAGRAFAPGMGPSAATPEAFEASQATLPVIATDPSGDGGLVDAVALSARIDDDSLTIQIDLSTVFAAPDFGAVVSLDTDRDATTGAPPPYGVPGQDIGADWFVYMFQLSNGIVDLFDALGTYAGSFPASYSTLTVRFTLPRSAITGGASGVDVDAVVGNDLGPTDLIPDVGHGSLGAWRWLTVVPDSGVVAAGQTGSPQARFVADGLGDGDYRADLVVASDDPDEAEIRVPVHLHVTGAPDVAVDVATLDFDSVFVGEARHRTFRVSNHGSQVLHVSSIQLADPGYICTIQPVAFQLAPSDTAVEVGVTLTAPSSGPIASSLLITSDDPDESPFILPVTGEAVPPPDVHLPVIAVDAMVTIGQQSSTPFTIDNLGPTPLAWSAEIVPVDTGVVIASAPPSTATAVRAVPKNDGVLLGVPPAPGPVLTMGPEAGARLSRPVSRLRSVGMSPLRAAGAVHAASGGTLTEVRDALDLRFAEVTAAIPDRFEFVDGITGTGIMDGGNDMFDLGNMLATSLGKPIPYSDTGISPSPFLGPGGGYFTRKYPGLFVFAADLDGATSFTIEGDLGADGYGSVDAATLDVSQGGVPYRGFVKRVYGAGDASVNHLIVVRDPPGLTHAYSPDTNSDFDRVSGFGGNERLYYLLFATTTGTRIDDATMLEIMRAFLRLIPASLVHVSPTAGVVPPAGSQQVTLGIDGRGLEVGVYAESLVIHTNDPDESRLAVPLTIHADTVTSIALSLVSAEADPDLARLVWYVASSSGAKGTVERREGAGAWAAIGTTEADGEGYLRFTDHAVTAGSTYGYRLHLGAPEEAWTTEAVLTIPRTLAFALQGAHPNPAEGELRVAFTLPDRTAATLELIDLAGRRVRSEEVGSLGPGRHAYTVAGTRTLPGGVYLIRLTRGGTTLVSKVAIVH